MFGCLRGSESKLYGDDEVRGERVVPSASSDERSSRCWEARLCFRCLWSEGYCIVHVHVHVHVHMLTTWY